MSVLAAHLLARNVVDEEVAPRGERQALADLSRREVAAHVLDDRPSLERDPLRGQLLDARGGGRGGGGGARPSDRVDVPNDACRVAHDHGVGGNRAGNHRPGPDHGALPDRQARQNRGIGPDRGPGPNRRHRVLREVLPAAGHRVVRERDVGSDEHVVFEADAVPDLHAALDGDAVSDDDVVLDEDVVAEIAVLADHGSGQDVRERPDPRTSTDLVALDERLGMSEVLGHADPPTSAGRWSDGRTARGKRR